MMSLSITLDSHSYLRKIRFLGKINLYNIHTTNYKLFHVMYALFIFKMRIENAILGIEPLACISLGANITLFLYGF